MLGCPHQDCPEHNAFLIEMNRAMDQYFEQIAWPPRPTSVDDQFGC